MKTVTRCALGILLVAVAISADAEVIDRVLAVVGQKVITLSDVGASRAFGLVPAETNADATANVLAFLVNRELMLSEVERYAVPEPDRALLDRRMAQIRGRFPGSDAFARELARTAMTEERLRTTVADNLRIETYLDQRFGAVDQPTPGEVQRYYDAHPAEFTRAGKLLPFDDVQVQAQERAAAERRAAQIADWLERLRRRAAVTTLLTPEK